MIATEGEGARFGPPACDASRCPRSTPPWRSCCRPWSGTCSATRPPWPSTPRPARCARPGPPSRRPWPRRPAGLATAIDRSTGCARTGAGAGRSRGASSRACGPGPTTATSKRPPPSGWSSLLRYATGALPIEGYELEYGKVGTPSALVDDLLEALTAAIDELTRPVDAIKHQAKTVTVGISRSEDALFGVRLVQETLAAGASQDQLGYRALRTLSELDAAVADGDRLHPVSHRLAPPGVAPPSAVIDRGGIGTGIPSRTARSPVLRHQAPGGRGARGHRRPGPQRRPDRDLRPRDQGRRGHRHDAAARRLPRRPDAGPGPPGPRPATATGTPPSPTPSPRPSRSSMTSCWPACRSSTC